MRTLSYAIICIFFITSGAYASSLDECSENRDCLSCKENLRCVKCTNYCYNKYGDPYDSKNFFVRSAAECTELCWEEGDEKKVRKAKKEEE